MLFWPLLESTVEVPQPLSPGESLPREKDPGIWDEARASKLAGHRLQAEPLLHTQTC